MDKVTIDRLGDELFEALRARSPVDPITDRETDVTIADAYRIQLRMLDRRLALGERIIGKKIGVTSKVVMDMLKVDQPDFGCLLSTMAFSEGEPISLAPLMQPRVEAEIAFILKADLPGPGVTVADVLRATECVMPCFEIVDSRIRDWKIRIQDTIADNGSAGAFMLGERAVSPHSVDLPLCGMVMEMNGAIVHTSAGAAALGHPANCVAWLANTLGRLAERLDRPDITLKAGEVILSGSLSPLIPVKPGDYVRASIGGMGSVSARFTE